MPELLECSPHSVCLSNKGELALSFPPFFPSSLHSFPFPHYLILLLLPFPQVHDRAYVYLKRAPQNLVGCVPDARPPGNTLNPEALRIHLHAMNGSEPHRQDLPAVTAHSGEGDSKGESHRIIARTRYGRAIRRGSQDMGTNELQAHEVAVDDNASGVEGSRRELAVRPDLSEGSLVQERGRGRGVGEQEGERAFVGVVNRWKPLPLSLSKLHPQAGDTLEILVSGMRLPRPILLAESFLCWLSQPRGVRFGSNVLHRFVPLLPPLLQRSISSCMVHLCVRFLLALLAGGESGTRQLWTLHVRPQGRGGRFRSLKALHVRPQGRGRLFRSLKTLHVQSQGRERRNTLHVPL